MEVIVTTEEKLKSLIAEAVNTALAGIAPQTIQQPLPDDKPLSTAEAVAFLGKSRQTLTAWRKAGIIRGRTLGGRVYFLKSELLSAMKGGQA